MPVFAPTELILIRHAPAVTEGRMAGKRDVAADCSNSAAFAALQARLDPDAARLISPALRCRQTANSLWPDLPAPESDARLWEQNFGAWEGMPFDQLPDLGALGLPDLAAHRPPQGESFADLYDRAQPALAEVVARGARKTVIIAHAGLIRAALGMALGQPHLGLAFQIAPLSQTRLIAVAGAWSIACVNEPAL
ncbi:histidine phosphatase family protein [Cypionkella sp.]|uniref:histidine phosphatase family protein n=1 Tax=Cypionkella sp. TaxID=2811411 RepID=UPI00375249C3